MKTKVHFHHDVYAWDGEFNETLGRGLNGVSIKVIGYTTESKAVERAKQMVRREHYRLNQVWECSDLDTEDLRNEQLQLIRKFNKQLGDEDES